MRVPERDRRAAAGAIIRENGERREAVCLWGSTLAVRRCRCIARRLVAMLAAAFLAALKLLQLLETEDSAVMCVFQSLRYSIHP